MVTAFVLFFVAGLGFGYATPGVAKGIPLLFPLLLAIGALFKYGLDAEIFLRLVIALLLTALGIVLGAALDARGARRQAAGAAP